MKEQLKGDGSFDIEYRNRLPLSDPINALLSFRYSLLTKEMTITLQAVGFDPLLGFMYQPRYGKPALALDLAEEFRPLIANSTVPFLVNNREVQASDFITRAGAVALTTQRELNLLEAGICWDSLLRGISSLPIDIDRVVQDSLGSAWWSHPSWTIWILPGSSPRAAPITCITVTFGARSLMPRGGS